jgi:hypothetical protein
MNAIRFIARMSIFVVTFIAIDLLTGPERDLESRFKHTLLVLAAAALMAFIQTRLIKALEARYPTTPPKSKE